MPDEDALARRLATVPGVGATSSSGFAASTPDVNAFRCARRGLREGPSGQARDPLDRLLARRPVKVAGLALANRMARTIWAFAIDPINGDP